MHNPSSSFIAQKNRDHNAPIWLYRIHLDASNPSGDLFLAEWDTDLGYFRTDNGVHTAQVYVRFPIAHGGLRTQATGEIDTPIIRVGNVSREMAAFIEQRGGLRGYKVTIRQIFYEARTDPDAYIEDVYFIDSVDYNEQEASFKLSSRLSILDVQAPCLRYSRNHCGHEYKGRGCWLDNGDGTFVAPSRFTPDPTVKLLPPDQIVASKTVGTTNAQSIAEAKFRHFDCLGLARDGSDYLEIDLKADRISNAAAGALLLSIGDGTNAWTVTIDPATISASWQAKNLNFQGFAEGSSPLDVRAIRSVKWVSTAKDGVSAASAPKLYFRNPRIHLSATTQWTNGKEDSCNHSLEHCRRHNNALRFGAQPGVPSKAVFRVG